MAECALIDLAIRVTPKRSEGLGFSLMMSVRNLALFGSDIFGSWLLDKYHIYFSSAGDFKFGDHRDCHPSRDAIASDMLGRKDAESIEKPAVSEAFP